MKFQRVAIVGVGLLGGSLGMALRSRGLAEQVVGWGRRLETLEQALQLRAVDSIETDLQTACSGADLVVVCTPVDLIIRHVQECLPSIAGDGLITDVGSTKQTICAYLAGQAPHTFCGSHPLAGSDKSGVSFANPDLFEGRLTVITPHEQAPTELVARTEALWQAVGSRTLRMSPSEHDRGVARTSHLPHIVAAALAAGTPEDLLPLAASGWCDTTRVAAGGVELWRQILLENRQPVLEALELFAASLNPWLEALHRATLNSSNYFCKQESNNVTLWEIDVHPAAEENDVAAANLASEARDLGLGGHINIAAAHGFLLQGELSQADLQRAAQELLVDAVTEAAVVAQVGDAVLAQQPARFQAAGSVQMVHVLPKPGVMDPVAQSTLGALRDMGLPVDQVTTFRKVWLSDIQPNELDRLCQKLLSNDSIERVIVGPLNLSKIDVGAEYKFALQHVAIRELDDPQLMQLSKQGQLYLTLAEMQTIQQHFQSQGREPTDIELETIAQTWSEHCSHKTLAGRIAYSDEKGSRQFKNMLKETIFQATQTIRAELGADDWCVKVFSDNAGIVKFDDEYHVVFKVETHNHPSAIEPYGGANTGIGGVIRDPMGTGLGAKPFCNTDIFCFAPPDTDANTLPPGVLHPRRVMKGVVSGVRDYGNRMGIPTINGAVYFDRRYLGNPLVYCGNAGLLPVDCVDKAPREGDWIVSIGGRTGRDGIHGATFSSAELTSESESISGGSVQIGNAVTEKMVLDVLLQARDERLYNAVTDCGAGGFSSAVGEMGESIGAEVWLERAPLKYEGLSYTEIWISEAQERMVFAVPPDKLQRMQDICAAEGVEASVIGQFVPTGLLRLMYEGEQVGVVSMEFLHEGRPPVVRSATYTPPEITAATLPQLDRTGTESALKKILGSLNVASKHWIIRQYDHEVQAGSAVKPLVGPASNGPGDAAVVRPRLDSRRGVVLSCGMNPAFGDLDPYHMAASAIDEAVRNAVAVGADPARLAILDNFCWGNTDRPETLGSLVRAALACHDVAVAWKTPFISGKDSLNNEFTWVDADGQRQSLAIPPSLLISAMGQVADVAQCVTMDFKEAGNPVYLIGSTHRELGGSHLLSVLGIAGGQVPQVNLQQAKLTFEKVHAAIVAGTIRACHDLSEGGLAVALAEMSFAGHLGCEVDLTAALRATESQAGGLDISELLFSESNSRFLVEVAAERDSEWQALMQNVPHVRLGEVRAADNVLVRAGKEVIVDLPWSELFDAWYQPLNW